VEVKPLSELGQFLKKARMEKKISIEEIQEITKIRKRYLEAIEKGEYNVLPGQFYARAFIKSYAEAIGLKAEAVLQQYSSDLPQVPMAPVETVVRKRKREVKTSSPKVGKWISRLVFYLFLFVVGFVIYVAIVNNMGQQPDQATDPNQPSGVEGDGNLGNGEDEDGKNGEKEEPIPEPEPEPEPEPAPEPTWTLIESTSSTTTFEYANAERMEITLQATQGAVWYNLRNEENGSTISEETLAQGNERNWNLSEYQQIRFRFGNTDVVGLLVNGEAIDISELPQTHNIVILYSPLVNE
jgi:cytoskeletal protein RodZ